MNLDDYIAKFNKYIAPNFASKCLVGTGPINDLMLIGEAPGKTEVVVGEPFVGPSGKLLRSTLSQGKYSAANFFFANSVWYRPKGPNDENRTPDLIELKLFWPLLAELITLVNPKSILLVGKIAQTNARAIQMMGFKTFNCHHPSYVLRKREAMPELVSQIANYYESLGR